MRKGFRENLLGGEEPLTIENNTKERIKNRLDKSIRPLSIVMLNIPKMKYTIISSEESFIPYNLLLFIILYHVFSSSIC